MYALNKIRERIHEAELIYQRSFEPHTPAEIDDFERHLVASNMYVYDSYGKPTSTQNLTEFESDWMLNEQVLILCDASYFLTRYAFLKDEENIIHRFSFRVPQHILYEIICDLESRDAAIEIMILKARQLGCSTLIELLIAHRVIFSYGINAIIGSADQTKTGLMGNMLFLAYDMLPRWLRPDSTRRVESDRGMLVFGHTASGVSFQHGAQTSGIARGTTPTIYHLSECASFTNAAQQIEASLFKAVHASPSVFGVLESTGEGDKGWWPDTWRHAKANWSDNRSRLCPIFLPWFCGVDIWPTPTWRRTHPAPPSWRPTKETREHVAKAELYVRSNPLLERHLINHQRATGELSTDNKYRMPSYQQWFWEVDHEEHKNKGIESIFLQEMAGDDEEALQRSSESVFGHETIQLLDDHRIRDYRVYGLSGQSIESAHEPPTDDIDYDLERIPVRYSSMRAETYRWELIPLRFSTPLNESVPEDASGKLIVFHPPTPGVTYSIGVDTSQGKGADSTVISVWSVGEGTQQDQQCAEFASPYVNHVEAFSFILCIAAYYAQYMEQGVTRWKEPLVSIEQLAAVGDTAQNQMKQMGYKNFNRFSRYDGKNPAKSKRMATRNGWFTTAWSRPLLLVNYITCAKNNWSQINSPWLINEMKHFEVHVTATGKEKLEHEEDEHDDRIFAAAIAIFCPHDMDKLASRSNNRLTELVSAPPIDLSPYRGQVITQSQLRNSSELTLNDLIYTNRRR